MNRKERRTPEELAVELEKLFGSRVPAGQLAAVIRRNEQLAINETLSDVATDIREIDLMDIWREAKPLASRHPGMAVSLVAARAVKAAARLAEEWREE